MHNTFELDKYLRSNIKTYKSEYIVSFVMNKDKLKEFEVKKFNLIILCRKYNKIYYDVQIINVDDVE